jgi:CRP-like cAMP-binding protein
MGRKPSAPLSLQSISTRSLAAIMGRVVLGARDLAIVARSLCSERFTPADLALGADHFTARAFRAGECLTRGGERAHTVGLVLEGVMREYFVLADGKDVTKNFALEGQLTGSIKDLLSEEPSRVWVAAETDARVSCVEWSIVEALAERSPAWQRLLHGVERRLHIAKEERELELLALDANERYRRFRQRFPGLEAHVSQRVVASYLGITPVHLSRMRRKTRER